MNRSIISDGEALRILKNDLRKSALEKHAAQLNEATPERKTEVLKQIDLEIEKELRRRAIGIRPDILLH